VVVVLDALMVEPGGSLARTLGAFTAVDMSGVFPIKAKTSATGAVAVGANTPASCPRISPVGLFTV
jgi:hypothetical protein